MPNELSSSRGATAYFDGPVELAKEHNALDKIKKNMALHLVMKKLITQLAEGQHAYNNFLKSEFENFLFKPRFRKWVENEFEDSSDEHK